MSELTQTQIEQNHELTLQMRRNPELDAYIRAACADEYAAQWAEWGKGWDGQPVALIRAKLAAWERFKAEVRRGGVR